MASTAFVTPNFRLDDIAKNVVAALVRADVGAGSVTIHTPYVAPGGTPIRVLMDATKDGWLVHDGGFGALEAELSGASRIYARIAREIAESSGLLFDHRMVFCADVPEAWLPNAVIAIGDAVKRALIQTADRLTMQIKVAAREVLFEKLKRRFGEEQVEFDAEVTGGAGGTWPVDALIISPRENIRAVFDLVSPHPNSIAAAFTKLSDIGDAPEPPRRFAVKQDVAGFDAPKITLLTRAASAVVELNSPIEGWLRAA